MMLARQPALGGVGQHLAHQAAQRVLGQEVVADMVGCHLFDQTQNSRANASPAFGFASARDRKEARGQKPET